MNLFKQRATTIALGIGVLVCAHVGVSHGEANGGSRDRSGWQIGTPIITYYHGPGGAGGRWGPLTPGMAKKLVDGGFTAAWGSAVKDLDVAHAHGLRVRLEVGDLMHHG